MHTGADIYSAVHYSVFTVEVIELAYSSAVRYSTICDFCIECLCAALTS